MSIALERRMLYLPVFHIDTNLINARQKLAAVNQLEEWYANGVILINISSIALGEAKADGDQLRTGKANAQIYTATPPVEQTDPLYQKVQSALFPNGAIDANKQNDVRIVCEAAKYAAILVTGDGASRSQPGGILGNRGKLRGIVEILAPQEAVDFVSRKITERDEFNRQIVAQSGGDFPDWTGKD